jgi:hypothetical protein
MLFAAALLVSLSCGEITKEELACEQAVSKLRDCCEALDARRLPCVESSGGCAEGSASPMLTPRASDCALTADCEHLVSSGACDGVVRLSLVVNSLKDRDAIEKEACR